MKFIVPRMEFMQAIKKIQNIVSPHPPLPILSHILIETTQNTLVLTASELKMSMRCIIPAKILMEGAVSVPSKHLFPLIRELTGTQITFSVESDGMIDLLCDSSRFRLHGMSKEGFPSLADLVESQKSMIPSKVLKEALFKTYFASAKEDNRFILTGVLFKIENQTASVVGTDGKRLATTTFPIDIDPTYQRECIIPVKAVEEISKILEDRDDVILYIAHDKLAIAYQNVVLVTKLLVGDFPAYEEIVQTKSLYHVTLHREELATLLKQVALFTEDTADSITFSFRTGELILTGNHEKIGEGHVSMPIDYDCNPIDIAFNPHYFLDILRHTKDETIELGITDSFTPGMITDSQNTLFIIMPMRLPEYTSSLHTIAATP